MGRPRKFPFKDGQMVEVIQACSIEVDGVTYAFQGGQKLRAAHEAVHAAPQLFQKLDEEFLPEVEQATAAPGEKRGGTPTAA